MLVTKGFSLIRWVLRIGSFPDLLLLLSPRKVQLSVISPLCNVHEVWNDESTLAEFAGQTVGFRNQQCLFFLSLRKHNIVLTPIWISRES